MVTRNSIFVFLVVLFSAALCRAQVVDPEKEKDIRRLIETMSQQRVSEALLPVLLRPLANQIIEANPELGETDFAEVFAKKMGPRIMDAVLREVLLPVLDRSLSHQEIRDLIAFWESPLGRHFSQAQIEMTRNLSSSEGFRVVQASMSGVLVDVLKEMEADFPAVTSFRQALEKEIPPTEDVENEELGPELLTAGEYVNRTANLRIAVPNGWKISKTLQADENVVGALTSPDRTSSLFFFRESSEGSLSDFKENIVAKFGSQKGFELLSESRMRLDGKPALRLTFRLRNLGQLVDEMATVIDEGEWMTMILGSSFEAHFEAAKPTLENISDSYSTLTKVVEEGVLSGQQYRTAAEVDGELQASKLGYRVAPEYPEQAKREGIEGVVSLLLRIDEHGSVTVIEPREGDPLLTKAAIEAVRQWGYTQTLLDDEPVPVIATVTVNFVLKRN